MTTSRKLWLGFGAVTGLLILCILLIYVWLSSIRNQVDEMAQIARLRSGTARELEIDVVEYSVSVHEYRYSGDRSLLGKAASQVSDIDRQLEIYERLARSDEQRNMAIEFRHQWDVLREQGQDLLKAEVRPSLEPDVSAFNQSRQRLNTLLDDRIQPNAVAAYEATHGATQSNIQSLLSFSLLLLGIGAALAAATGATVGRAIARDAGILAANSEHLRITLSSIGDAVLTTDRQGLVVNLNPVAESLTGWSNLEAAGRPLDDIFRIINETTRQPAPNPATKSLATGEIVGLANHTILIARNGVECPIDDSAAPIRGKSGQIEGCVLVFRDVTSQRHEENALRESESFVRRVLDNLNAFVGVMTPDGTILQANRAAVEAAGLPQAELVNKKFWDTFWWNHCPDVQQRLKQAIERAAAGEHVRYDEQVRLAGNVLIWIDFQLAPLFDDMGRITHLIPSGLDVTARRDAEANLRVAQDLQKRALDAANVGHWDLDVPTREISWGPGALRLFGLDSESAPIDVSDTYLAVHPDDRTRLASAIQTAIDDESPYTCEFRVVWPDGSIHWILGQGEFVEFTPDGKPLRMVGLNIDITSRKHSEEALRESEERFRAMANELPLIVWLHNHEGNLEFVNQTYCDYYDVTREEMLDNGWKVLVHPEDAGNYSDEFAACVREHRPFHAEARIKRASGDWRWIESWGRPRFNRDGAYLGHLGVSADITSRKLARQQLEEANKQKDRFLAVLAHELRNPLAPIRLGVELLKGLEDAVERERIRAMMERQVQQLTVLVDDLLDASRISGGKLELHKKRVSLDDVVEIAVDSCRELIDHANHQLTIALPSPPITLEADLHRLAQVISNLLNNAAKFTPRGGRIELSAIRNDGEIVISVKDSGIGIPASKQQQIFDMFTQIDHPLEHGLAGLGIGLTLVKSLVEMHGGDIEVFSLGVNKGTEFRVRLHPEEVKASRSIESPSTNGSSGPATRRRVLVVDDNQAAATMLTMLVEAMGHDVRTAGDGRTAIEEAAEFRPEVVLMDVGMPGMNGLEAASHIRRQPWGRTITLVALTGWGQDEDKRRTSEAGFDHHLVKPVGTSELLPLLGKI